MQNYNPLAPFFKGDLVAASLRYDLGRAISTSVSGGFSIDSTIRFSINSFAKSPRGQM